MTVDREIDSHLDSLDPRAKRRPHAVFDYNNNNTYKSKDTTQACTDHRETIATNSDRIESTAVH